MGKYYGMHYCHEHTPPPPVPLLLHTAYHTAYQTPAKTLNASPDLVERESEIVGQAGRLGLVTVATNMAGRGTDILLGGNPSVMARIRVRDALARELLSAEDLAAVPKVGGVARQISSFFTVLNIIMVASPGNDRIERIRTRILLLLYTRNLINTSSVV